MGDDLLNLCIIAGPKDCAVVRHTYLHGNRDYLEHFLRKYVAEEIDAWKCRGCYRAWMEINDWRKQVTDKLIGDLAVVGSRYPDGLLMSIDSYAPFNNPSVAIEIGLMEVLKYLVEEKGIDVNAYRWTSYTSLFMFDNQTCHLLMECVVAHNIEAFKYILGRSNIDFSIRAMKTTESCSVFEIVCRQSGLDAAFLQSFIDYSNFDEESIISERECNIPVLHWSIISSIVDSAKDWFDLPAWKSNFKYILNAGANPHRSSENGNAIQYAKSMLIDYPEHHEALEYAIKIMEK